MRRQIAITAGILVLALMGLQPAVGQDAGGLLDVVVVDESGAPLEGVQVRADDGDPSSMEVRWTDADGRALLYAPHDGDWAVRFEPPDDRGAIQWRGGSAGRSGGVPASLRGGEFPAQERIVLPQGGAVAGSVRLQDGTPVPFGCALIRTSDGDLVTRGWGDAQGRYATRRTIPEGSYVVEFQHCGSPTTWGWHGGGTLETAAPVTVTAGQVTDGVDAALDPAAGPDVQAVGVPTSDAEVREQLDLLNRFREQMGLAPLQVDWVMVDANRLHGRYSVNTGSLAHDEDPSSPWYTPEGDVAAMASGLSGAAAVVDLSSAPFHWFPVLDPWARWAGTGGWISGTATAGGLHMRPESATTEDGTPVNRPGDPPGGPADWPVLWPADGSVAAGLAHHGEEPPPAGACPGYLDPSQEFQSFGFPMMAQFDHYGELVDLADHEVRVDGTPVDSCALTRRTYDNPADGSPELSEFRLRQYNAVIVLPREPLPQGAAVDVDLRTTTHGDVSWSFTTPINALTYGAALPAGPGRLTSIAQEPTAREAAIALSRRLFGLDAAGFAVGPYRVVLCREDVFADCLAVTPVLDDFTSLLFTAGGPDAPLPPEVRAEIERLRGLDPQLGVVLAGGSAAVSDAQEQEIRDLGIDIERHAGAGRIATATSLAAQYGAEDQPVLLARDGDWADAITAGAYASRTQAPVLLNPTGSLHADVQSWLADHPGREVVVLGGRSAIGDAVVQQLQQLGHPVRRMSGGSRVETSVAIARDLWGRTATAPGDAFAFADTFAADGWQPTLLAAQLSSWAPTPILVASGEELHPAVTDYLEQVVTAPVAGVVAGTAASASDAIAPLLED